MARRDRDGVIASPTISTILPLAKEIGYLLRRDGVATSPMLNWC
jgi:hypothetical protein